MSPRLLIVDDQDDIRLMLQILLEDQGWDTEQAPSGEQALRLAGSRVAGSMPWSWTTGCPASTAWSSRDSSARGASSDR